MPQRMLESWHGGIQEHYFVFNAVQFFIYPSQPMPTDKGELQTMNKNKKIPANPPSYKKHKSNLEE
jgi:hypothetical protein